MRNVLAHSRGAVLDDRAVARIRAACELRRHALQARHVRGEILEDGGAVAEHVVGGEHGVFLGEHEGHVVGRVAGAVVRAEGGAFDGEGLAVGDGGPAGIGRGRVLVHAGAGGEGEEVGDAADVVVVPVGEERGVNGYVGGGEGRLEGGEPFGFALARVDEEAAGAGADDVCVRAWGGVRAGVEDGGGDKHLGE